MIARSLGPRLDWVAVAISLVAAVLIAALPADAFPRLAGAIVLTGLVGWIAWQDSETFTIPDGAVAGIVLVGTAMRVGDGLDALHDPRLVLQDLALDAIFCSGSLFLLRELFYRCRGYDGLGFGDVKFAFAGGVLVGVQGFACATCGACTVALAVILVRGIAGRPTGGRDRIPLGAFLAPATLLAWVAAWIAPSLDPTGL